MWTSIFSGAPGDRQLQCTVHAESPVGSSAINLKQLLYYLSPEKAGHVLFGQI